MIAYSGIASRYDALTGDVDYNAYCAFYQNQFRNAGTEISSVLDLGCGTGTLTILLAKNGFDMVGVDAQPEMLSEAANKIAREGLGGRVLLLNQRMEELDLYGTVDAAVSSLDCLNYLRPDLLPEVFRRLHLFIRPKGMLLFDIISPEGLRQTDGQIYCDEQDDVFCIWRSTFDEEEQCCRYLLDCFSRGRGGRYDRTTEEHMEYVHEPQQLQRLLEEAGFTDLHILSGDRIDAVGKDGRRLFVTARRGE